MLKIRIIAAVMAVLLTLLTIYLLPKAVYLYTSFVGNLSPDQQNWFNWMQVVLGVSLAAYGFWRWKKKDIKNN